MAYCVTVLCYELKIQLRLRSLTLTVTVFLSCLGLAPDRVITTCETEKHTLLQMYHILTLKDNTVLIWSSRIIHVGV